MPRFTGEAVKRMKPDINPGRVELGYRFLTFFVGLMLLIWLWERLSTGLSPLVLPGPEVTLRSFLRLWHEGEIIRQLAISLRRAVTGLFLAYILALFLGIIMHRSRLIHYILQPWLDAVQMVPAVVWLIFAVLWFGVARESTPVFVVFVVCLPVVQSQVREGLQAIPPELVDLAAMEPLSFLGFTRHVVFPALRPSLLSSATLGFSFAWRSVVFAEFIGSNSGLGYQLNKSYYHLATDEVFAWTAVLVVLMWIWQELVVARWRRQGSGVTPHVTVLGKGRYRSQRDEL
jgi:NitT/TauT family transport system permease protein